MNQKAHFYFGVLDTEKLSEVDVIWEKEFSLNDTIFTVSLWADGSSLSPIDFSLLDSFSDLISDLSGLDEYCRLKIEESLIQDRSFIDFHVEEISENSEVISELLRESDSKSISCKYFVSRMKLTNIGLWLNSSDSPIVLDYMIDQDNSDEILAVKLTDKKALVDIEWES